MKKPPFQPHPNFSFSGFASLAPASLALRAACGKLPRERPLSGGQRFSFSPPSPHFSFSAFQRFSFSTSGSSLVTTLLVITVLTIIVVAFMTSMGVERRTSQSYANLERAQLAAQAGDSAAAALIKDLFERFPDSITTWQSIPIGATNNEATVFQFRANFNAGASFTNPAQLVGSPPSLFNEAGTNRVGIYAIPLASGAEIRHATNILGSLGTSFVTNQYVNLNAEGLIGERVRTNIAANFPNLARRPQLFGRWIEILEDPARPRNLQRGSPDFNPPIARYAFWVDDDSFSLNLNTSGQAMRGNNTLGTNMIEANLVTLLRLAGTNIAGANSITASLVNSRTNLPENRYHSVKEMQQIPGVSTNVYDTMRFSTTERSGALDLSRGGFRRVNLNTLFSGTTTNLNLARTNVARFTTAVTNSNSSPLFGQRFYRTLPLNLNATNVVSLGNSTMTGIPERHQDIYLQKIAANVKDFIDADNQPTIIRNNLDFTHALTPYPNEGVEPAIVNGSGPNPYAAVGKERTPFMQEAVVRVFLKQMEPRGWSGVAQGGTGRQSATYDFDMDYYFEFYNPYNQDIVPDDLGNDPHIRVYNQPEMNSNAGNPSIIPEGRDFAIRLRDIPNLVFQAGAVTVITTDQNPNPEYWPNNNPTNRFVAPLASPGSQLPDGTPLLSAATRTYQGTTRDSTDSDKTRDELGNQIFNNTYRIRVQGRNGTDNGTDYATGYLLANEIGLLEGFLGIGLARSDGTGQPLTINAQYPQRLRNNFFFNRGSSLRGNTSNSAPGNPGISGMSSGDPRSTVEPLSIDIWLPRPTGSVPADADHNFAFRFWPSMSQPTGINDGEEDQVPGSSSLYRLNTNFVDQRAWPDWSNNNTGTNNAPSILKNSELVSIGELGHVFDPVRRQFGTARIDLARAGGRTLRIGQPESFVADNNFGLWGSYQSNTDTNVFRLQTSASRTWTSWRLADIFTVDTNLFTEGKININGLRRDNGLAFEALVDGLSFQLAANDGAPSTQGRQLSPAGLTNIRNLTRGIISRLSGNFLAAPAPSPAIASFNANIDMPFWERGELSELSFFRTGNTIAGADMNQTLDRGREELFRRIVEMICVKGNIFTIYAVGEALDVDAQGNIRTVSRASSTSKIQLAPQFSTPASDDFNPFDNTEVPSRFAQPSRYEIQVLSSN